MLKKKLLYFLKWISMPLESGRSTSQVRGCGVGLTQMASTFLSEMKLSALTAVAKPEISSYVEQTELARNLERLSIWRNKNGSQGFYLEKFECELGHTDSWVGCRIKYSPDSGPDSIFACPYSLTHPHKSSANNKTVTMLKSLVETWEVNNVVPALFSPSGYLGEQHSFF